MRIPPIPAKRSMKLNKFAHYVVEYNMSNRLCQIVIRQHFVFGHRTGTTSHSYTSKRHSLSHRHSHRGFQLPTQHDTPLSNNPQGFAVFGTSDDIEGVVDIGVFLFPGFAAIR